LKGVKELDDVCENFGVWLAGDEDIDGLKMFDDDADVVSAEEGLKRLCV